MVKRKSTFGEIRSKFLVVHPDIDQEKEELRNVLIETSDGCIACPMVCLSKSEGGRIWPTKGPHPPRWGTFSTKAWRRDDIANCPFSNEVGEGGSRHLARDG